MDISSCVTAQKRTIPRVLESGEMVEGAIKYWGGGLKAIIFQVEIMRRHNWQGILSCSCERGSREILSESQAALKATQTVRINSEVVLSNHRRM